MGTMSLVNNMAAMNASRQLGLTTKARAKRTEKLSSGYRINRAADDAAGLAISEKMRRQVRGLRQSMRNIQDGISLLQVADGAMNEVHDILNRMETLAVQSANGTNTDTDRGYLDQELQHLMKEIDKVGVETTFNERRVFTDAETTAYTLENPTANSKFFKLLGDDVSHTGYMNEALAKDKIQNLPNTGYHDTSNAPYMGVHIDFGNIISDQAKFKELAGTEFYVNCCTDCCPRVIKFADEAGITKNGNTTTIGLMKSEGVYYDNAEEFCKAIVDAKTKVAANHVMFAYEGSTLYAYDIDNNEWSESSKKLAYFCDNPGQSSVIEVKEDGIRIQSGAEAGDYITIHTGALSCATLGLEGDSCATVEKAENLIGNVKTANRILSEQRSRIGAYTNRLEHSYNINANTAENTDYGESRIRDEDMAEGMVNYTMLNTLEQAGVSMLSQANQSSQRILSLLQ